MMRDLMCHNYLKHGKGLIWIKIVILWYRGSSPFSIPSDTPTRYKNILMLGTSMNKSNGRIVDPRIHARVDEKFLPPARIKPSFQQFSDKNPFSTDLSARDYRTHGRIYFQRRPHFHLVLSSNLWTPQRVLTPIFRQNSIPQRISARLPSAYLLSARIPFSTDTRYVGW